MAQQLTIKQNDTRTAIKATFKTPSGNPVDLTDATVNFYMAKYKKIIVQREADVLDAVNGKVAFSFNEGETAETGLMEVEFKVEYPDGSIETFPNSGYILVNIEADLA